MMKNVVVNAVKTLPCRADHVMHAFKRHSPSHSKSNNVPKGYWNNPANQREFFDWIGMQLGVSNPEDWYRLTHQDIKTFGGASLLNSNGSSIEKLLQTAYPEVTWQPWKFKSKDCWSISSNRRAFLESFAQKMACNNTIDWYNSSKEDIVNHGGQGLLEFFGHDVCKMLQDAFPEFHWKPFRFVATDPAFWSNLDNHTRFFEYLKHELDIRKQSHWLRMTMQVVVEHGGKLLLEKYEGSPWRALPVVYPMEKWPPWMLGVVPSGFWNSLENQRYFFDWLGSELEIERPHDWYRVSTHDIVNHGGQTILRKYKSPRDALLAVYPHLEECLRYYHLPTTYFRNPQHPVQFLKWFARQNNIQKEEDWYKVSTQDIVNHGGRELLKYGSISSLLQTTMPNIRWQPWRFASASELSEHKDFLQELANKFLVHHHDDWYGVSQRHVCSVAGGREVLSFYGGSLLHLLKVHYPFHKWSIQKWKNMNQAKTQQLFYRLVKSLVSADIPIEYNAHSVLLRHQSGKTAQLDVWFPTLNVGIEYHGEQHFMDGMFMNKEVELGKQYRRDSTKVKNCNLLHILLLEIPFWFVHDVQCIAHVLQTFIHVK